MPIRTHRLTYPIAATVPPVGNAARHCPTTSNRRSLCRLPRLDWRDRLARRRLLTADLNDLAGVLHGIGQDHALGRHHEHGVGRRVRHIDVAGVIEAEAILYDKVDAAPDEETLAYDSRDASGCRSYERHYLVSQLLDD